MPMAAAAIAAAWTTVAAAATTFVSALTFASGVMAGISAWSTVASVAALGTALMMKPPGLGSQGQQVNIQMAGPNAAVPLIFGRTGTQGIITYRGTYGTNNDILIAEHVLSVGPVAEIESFSVTGRALTYSGNPNTGMATVTQVAGVDMRKSKLYRYDGLKFAHRVGSLTDTSTLSSITGDSVPWINSTHTMPGLARTILRCKLDEKRLNFPEGYPDDPISVVKGVKCYDPRLDSTYPGGSGSHRWDDQSTHEWSENPFIVGLNFIRGWWGPNSTKLFGLGAPRDLVDVASFVSAANVADANDWTVGGQVLSTDGDWTILTNILASGGGVPTDRGGRISCFVRSPKVSTFTLNSADVLNSRKVTTTTPMADRVNVIVPSCRQANQKWELIAGEAVTDASWLTQDGGNVRTEEIAFPLVSNFAQAHQLAAYYAVDSREFLEFEVQAKPRALAVDVGDCIEVDLPEFTDGQTWIVMGRKWDPAAKIVSLILKSETFTKHAFALGQSQVAPEPPELVSFDPTNPAGPGASDWTIAANSISTGGTVVPAVVVAGEVLDPNVQKVIVETRLSPVTEADVWPDGVPVDLTVEDIAYEMSEFGWTLGAEGSRVTGQLTVAPVAPATAFDVSVRYERLNGALSERLILGPMTSAQDVAGGVRDGGIDWQSNTITNVPPAIQVDENGHLSANYVVHGSNTIASIIDNFDIDLTAVNVEIAQVESDLANAIVASNSVLIGALDGANELIAQATAFRDNAATAADGAATERDNALSAALQALANAVSSANSATWAQANAVTASTRAGYAGANATAAQTSAGVASTQAGYASANASLAMASANLSATYSGQAQANAIISSAQAGYATANASTASTQAGLSATYAGQASANATAAQTSAGIASIQAGYATANASLASSNSTLAATYATGARATTASLLPSDFDLDGAFWTHDSQTKVPAELSGWSFTTGAGVGRVATRSNYGDIATRGYLTLSPGRRLRFTARVRFTSDNGLGTGNRVSLIPTGFSSSFAYLSSGYVAITNKVAADGWFDISIDMLSDTMIAYGSGTGVYARPVVRNTAGNLDGGATTATIQIAWLRSEDVTESFNASSNATISQTQAGYATANASLASSSQTLAATYRDQAAANATAASGSAATATSQAIIATTQAGYATANATLASTSSTLSASHASNAAGSYTNAVIAGGNFHFVDGLTGWTAPGGTYADTHNGRANVVTFPASGNRIARNLRRIPVDTTRRYRVTAELYAGAGTGNALSYTGVKCFDATGTYIAERYPAASGIALTPNAGWTTQTGVITGTGSGQNVFPVGTTAVELFCYTNDNVAAMATALNYVTIEDVTESVNAAANATIATTQAAYATSNASVATTQAGLSATFAGYSQSNATIATTQAGYSTANASLASTSSSLSATYRDQAAANATAASGSAGIATTQAGYASANATAASTSSSLSAIYRDQAAANATAASGSAGIATTQAGYASANATAASTNATLSATRAGYAQANATIATTQAGYASANAALASTSSTLAATYRDGAITASRNFGFEHGLTGWISSGATLTYTSSHNGRPNVVTLASGGTANIFSTIKIPVDFSTRKYRVRGRYFTGAGSGSSQVYIGFRAYDAAENALTHNPGSYAYVAALGVMQAAGAGWVEYVSGVIVPEVAGSVFGYPVGTAQIEVLALMNYNSAAIPTALDEIVFEDVTESFNAAANAVIATNQAAYATANASLASTSQTLAATYSGYAQSNATAASGSAGTATTQAGIATTQAGYATANAAFASSNATLSATRAGYAQSNATIATTQAGYASANATAASTSSTLAATYRDQAVTTATSLFPERIGSAGEYFFKNTTSPTVSSDVASLSGFGNVRTMTAGGSVHVTAGLIPATSGKIYEVTTELELAVLGTGTPTCRPIVYGYDASGTYLTVAVAASTTLTTVGSSVTITRRFGVTAPTGGTAWPTSSIWLRAGVQAQASSSSTVYVKSVRVRDVTALVDAESNATVATTQAGYATANASLASASQTLAATHSGYAQSNATAASTSAATATASAAAASSSASIAASVGHRAMNPNAGFDDYPTGASVPTGWLLYDGNSSSARLADPGGGYAATVTGVAGASTGLYQLMSPGTSANDTYYVMEAEVVPSSGVMSGAGVYVAYYNDSWASYGGSAQIHFGTDPTSSGEIVGAGVAGRRYSFSKLFKTSATNATRMQIYAFNQYSGFVSNAASKSINWYRCVVRPATAQEVAAGVALPALSANVTTLQSTVTNLDTNYALARWEVAAAASGGLPTRIRLTSSTYGSNIALEASEIHFGDNTVFDDATDTLRTTIGSSIRVIAFGSAFGTDGQLTEWEGPSSTAFASMSRANAYFYRANVSPYFGGSAIPGGLTIGLKAFSGSSGGSSVTATVNNVTASSYIEFSASIDGGSLDADAPQYGTMTFEESSNGTTWATIGTASVTIGSSGLDLGGGIYQAEGGEGSASKVGTKSGNVQYRVTYARTSGSNYVGGATINATVRVTPPIS